MMKTPDQNIWLKRAYLLSLFTIGYNLLEGIFSVGFGAEDEALTLFGFGIDSFVEVISGFGIAHMVIRMRKTEVTEHDRFERQALRITGTSFFLLAAGLLAGVAINLIQNNSPSTTLPGFIISLVSIVSMYYLMRTKLKAGKALRSGAIIADAHCTRTCLYLSFILLISSGLHEFFAVPYIDLAGSLGIAWYAFNEGKEAFERVKNNELSC